MKKRLDKLIHDKDRVEKNAAILNDIMVSLNERKEGYTHMEILADLAFSTEVPRRKSANFLFSLVDPLKLEGFRDAL